MRRRRSKHRLHCEGKQNALVAFRLPEELLVALDGAARALKLTRSALFRRIAERSLAEAVGQAVEVARSDRAHPTGRLKALRLLDCYRLRAPAAISVTPGPAPSADLDDHLDLNRDLKGQRSHADRRAGAAALGAEDLDHEVGEAVDHL